MSHVTVVEIAAKQEKNVATVHQHQDLLYGIDVIQKERRAQAVQIAYNYHALPRYNVICVGMCRVYEKPFLLLHSEQLLKVSSHLDLLKVNPRDSKEVQKSTAEFAKMAFGEDLVTISTFCPLAGITFHICWI